MRGPGGTALGGNPDDAVGRLNSVQRRRRRSLHDLDVLDIIRNDVVDPRRTGVLRVARPEAAEVQRAGARAALEPDAVEVVERLVGERDAVRPADADPGSGSGGPATLEDLHACRAPRNQIGELGDRRRLGDLRGVDRAHGVADLELALLAGCGSYHLVELDRRRAHGKVERRRRPTRHRHTTGVRPVSYPQDAELIVARRHIAEGVLALAARCLDAVAARDQDAGPLEAHSAVGVGHLSRDRAGLRRGAERHAYGQAHE